MVRDSMDPETLVIRYPASSWKSFLRATRTGALNVVARQS